MRQSGVSPARIAASLAAAMFPPEPKQTSRSPGIRPERAAASVRLLAERTRVVAEGAGALALAAARSGRIPGERIVCIVSGGNIDAARLATILAGETPD